MLADAEDAREIGVIDLGKPRDVVGQRLSGLGIGGQARVKGLEHENLFGLRVHHPVRESEVAPAQKFLDLEPAVDHVTDSEGFFLGKDLGFQLVEDRIIQDVGQNSPLGMPNKLWSKAGHQPRHTPAVLPAAFARAVKASCLGDFSSYLRETAVVYGTSIDSSSWKSPVYRSTPTNLQRSDAKALRHRPALPASRNPSEVFFFEFASTFVKMNALLIYIPVWL